MKIVKKIDSMMNEILGIDNLGKIPLKRAVPYQGTLGLSNIEEGNEYKNQWDAEKAIEDYEKSHPELKGMHQISFDKKAKVWRIGRK